MYCVWNRFCLPGVPRRCFQRLRGEIGEFYSSEEAIAAPLTRSGVKCSVEDIKAEREYLHALPFIARERVGISNWSMMDA